jgi:hypothetical protein
MKRLWLLGSVYYLSLLIAVTALNTRSAAQVRCASGVCVTTWHNDNLRTGQNTNEQRLTKTLVGDDTSFGRICSAQWPTPDNFVYARPLVVTNVMFNGTTRGYADGIVWAIESGLAGSPPVLYAFDATNLSNTLYNTHKRNPNGSYPDQPGTPTKFSVPTVANGYVYIATRTDFDIYGRVTTRSCH